MGFTLDDLCTLVVQGFKSAFLPFREKADVLAGVNREIAAVRERFALAAAGEAARPDAGGPAHPAAKGPGTAP
jgi:adenosine deaminase